MFRLRVSEREFESGGGASGLTLHVSRFSIVTEETQCTS